MSFFSKVILPYLSLIILFAVCLVVLKLFVTNGMFLFEHDPKAMDFLAFYTGASLVFQNPSEMYNLLEQVKLQHQLVPAAQITNVFLPFFNPPFVALILSPLALIPIMYAYTVWTGINIILLVIICFLFYKHVPLSRTFKIISLIGILTFIPVLSSLLLGQLTFVLTFIFLLIWIALKQNKELQAGLLLSLVLMKPHFFMLPAIAFVLQRRWNVLKGLVLGSVLLIIISFGTIGIDGMREYIQLLLNASTWSTGYGIDIKAQHSLQTLFLILFQTDSLSAIRIPWIIAVLAISGATLFAWTKHHAFSSAVFAQQFALLLVASLLISPHTHFHDFMLFIVIGIALGFAYAKQKAQQYKYLPLLISLGYIICLTGYIIELYFMNGSRLGWIVITVSYLLILWSYILYTLLKRK